MGPHTTTHFLTPPFDEAEIFDNRDLTLLLLIAAELEPEPCTGSVSSITWQRRNLCTLREVKLMPIRQRVLEEGYQFPVRLRQRKLIEVSTFCSQITQLSEEQVAPAANSQTTQASEQQFVVAVHGQTARTPERRAVLLLFWIEAMNLLKRLSECIKTLESISKVG